MYCTECGNTVEDEHRFCSYCGIKISRSVSELTRSGPELAVKYRVDYSGGSWLSRFAGKIIYAILWFAAGVAVSIGVFVLIDRFGIIIVGNTRNSISLVIGIYCAFRWGLKSRIEGFDINSVDGEMSVEEIGIDSNE